MIILIAYSAILLQSRRGPERRCGVAAFAPDVARSLRAGLVANFAPSAVAGAEYEREPERVPDFVDERWRAI